MNPNHPEENPNTLESQAPAEEVEEVEDVEEEEAAEEEEAEAEAGDEQDAWAEEFTPEELAELFGGEEKVPAPVEVLEPAAPEHDEDSEEESDAGERLQKLLARSGVASRRAAEELIRTGRVSVNGEVVMELGRRARSDRDRIAVDGKPLRVPGMGSTVVLLNKPRGCVSTKDDPQGRTTVMAFLPKKLSHLHPVGRLDFDTSGLLLLTDDGGLTNLLLHPSHGVEKRYHARVRGVVSTETIDRLQKGVRLDDGVTEPCRVRVKAQTPNNALLEIVLREGRNRQIRRMLQAVGHPVSALRRVRLGPLDLGGLPAGAHRELLPGEVHLLKKAALAPKPALKAARPFAYKPRPSKAQDKTLLQPPARAGARGASEPPSARPSRPTTPHSGAPRDTDSHRGADREDASRSEGARPYAPRETSPRPHGPRDGAPREGDRPRAPREGGARPYAPREGGARSGDSRPYAPRDGSARSSGPRDGASREGNSSREGARRYDSREGGSRERPSDQRPAPRSSGARPDSRRPGESSAERSSERSSERGSGRPSYPSPRGNPREDRGGPRSGSTEGRYAPGSASSGAERGASGGARASRPPSPRPPSRRPDAAAPRDGAPPVGHARQAAPRNAGSSRPSAHREQDGAPRSPRPSGASGVPNNRPKLAKRIEDRWK